MKKIVLLFAMAFVALSVAAQCSGNCSTCTTHACQSGVKSTPAAKQVDYVEILFLHGKKSDKNRTAVEKALNTLQNGELADLVKSGTVRVKIVDSSTDNGAALAKKYKGAATSLFVIAHGNGKATSQNLTGLINSKAVSDNEAFRKELVAKVKAALK